MLGEAKAKAEEASREAAEEKLARQVRDAARNLNESITDIAARLNSEIHLNFYSCVVFQTQEQLDAFHQAAGVSQSDDGPFVDGRELAKALKIKLPAGPSEWREAVPSKTWARFALPVIPLPEKTTGASEDAPADDADD